jgi:hypothetical protein
MLPPAAIVPVSVQQTPENLKAKPPTIGILPALWITLRAANKSCLSPAAFVFTNSKFLSLECKNNRISDT